MSAPGWYPDPSSPYLRRWWSGTEWTAYTMPAYSVPSPRPSSQPTDGFAIASLVTSLIGLTPVGIALGLVAKRRIRQSEGRRGGDGLATAGIAVGTVFLALTGVIVILAVSGVFDEVNADDYSGEEARVATVVDRFEEAYENTDGRQICDEIFTPGFASEYSSSGGGCAGVWSEGTSGYAEIDIHTLTITGDSATAIADDEDHTDDWVINLSRENGVWRISGIDGP